MVSDDFYLIRELDDQNYSALVNRNCAILVN